MALVVSSPPAARVLDRDTDVKDQLRIEASFTDDDDHLDRLILDAEAELDGPGGWLGRCLITQTLVLTLPLFPTEWSGNAGRAGAIRLMPRLQSVSEVRIRKPDGTLEVLDAADYDVDTAAEPGLLYPAWDEVWPPVRGDAGSVKVTFVAGYGATAAAVPEEIRQHMLHRVSMRYEQRTPVALGTIVTPVPGFGAGALERYRVRGVHA